MRLSTKLSGIVAIGGVAALGAGLISSGGIGANFFAHADATANINVGDFGCELLRSAVDTAHTVTFSKSTGDHYDTADVTLPTITTSASGHASAPISVHNYGDADLVLSWFVGTDGDIFDSGVVAPIPVIQGQVIPAGQSVDVTIGAQWSVLGNEDLGTSGTVEYYATCSELPNSSHPNLVFFGSNGGTGEWTTNSNARFVIPTGSNGAGTGFNVLTFPQTLPATGPSYTANSVGVFSPRITIYFQDGSYLRGVASGSGAHIVKWNWAHAPAGAATTNFATWTDVLASTDLAGETVTYVQVNIDSSGTGSSNNGGVVPATGTVDVTCFHFGTIGYGPTDTNGQCS